MRTLTFALVSVIAVSAQATNWSTTNFSITNAGTPTSIETSTPTSIKRAIQNFAIGSNVRANIAWTFNFDTASQPAFNSVTLTIRGRVDGLTAVRVRGSENVFSTVPSSVLAGSGLATLDLFNSSSNQVAWVATATVALNPAVSQGFVSKDISIRSGMEGGSVYVDEIVQEFTPVPEPATMTALGLGALALMRRRKKA